MYIRISRLLTHCCITVITLLCLCTFNTTNDDPLIMTLVGTQGDTVSLWPVLTFSFSIPLLDSIVPLTIEPDPGPQYMIFLNEKLDTLTFVVTGALEGNTLYTFSIDDIITAENGNKLYPGAATFTIITYPKEKEPNSSLHTADVLQWSCYGTINPVHDTDYFYIGSMQFSALYLKNHSKRTGIAIVDTTGNIIASDISFNEVKTIPFISVSLPVYAAVFSLIDNDARYEIGLKP